MLPTDRTNALSSTSAEWTRRNRHHRWCTITTERGTIINHGDGQSITGDCGLISDGGSHVRSPLDHSTFSSWCSLLQFLAAHGPCISWAICSRGATATQTAPNSEHEDADARSDSTQVLDAGAKVVREYLAKTRAERAQAGGHYDNSKLFRGTVVSKGGEQSGQFAVVSRRFDPDSRGFRFGIDDESARLNLSMLLVHDVLRKDGGRSVLLALPGMKSKTADAILDWIDEDDIAREFGAEADFYVAKSAKPRNGPLHAIEELLFVRGVTTELLYGLDKNRNGFVDADERESADDKYPANDNSAELGWSSIASVLFLGVIAWPPSMRAEEAEPDAMINANRAQADAAAAKTDTEEGDDSAAEEFESAKDLFTDPDTGLQYHKVADLTNKLAMTPYQSLSLSPNGKFFLANGDVIPVDGGAPFKFHSQTGSWSPDGRKIVFRAEVNHLSVVTVDPETARPVGPPERLVEGHAPVAWSPDGKAFAYTSAMGGLWTYSLQDHSKVRLTDERVMRWPAWSPDGKWIAVIAARKAGGHLEVISADGRTSRTLATKNLLPILHWTPDSEWVFFHQVNLPFLHFVRVADSLRVELTMPFAQLGARWRYLRWPADGGKMFVYQPAYEGFKALKLVSAAGDEVRQLLRKPRYSGNEQRWSPDSKYVVTRNWSGYSIVPVSGAKPYPIKLDPSFRSWPTFFSPDNRKLALSNLKGDGLYTAPMSLELGRMTGVPVKVFDGRIELGGMLKPVIAIKWSPDGSRLAMLHDHNLWIANSDGSAPRRLTDNSDRKSSLAWSSDSREIQWTSYSSTTRRATRYACELPESKPWELCALPTGAFDYQWSKDGRTVVYSIRDGEEIGVWCMAVPAGGSKELFELKQKQMQGWARALSPDGKMLHRFLGQRGLAVFASERSTTEDPRLPRFVLGTSP